MKVAPSGNAATGVDGDGADVGDEGGGSGVCAGNQGGVASLFNVFDGSFDFVFTLLENLAHLFGFVGNLGTDVGLDADAGGNLGDALKSAGKR